SHHKAAIAHHAPEKATPPLLLPLAAASGLPSRISRARLSASSFILLLIRISALRVSLNEATARPAGGWLGAFSSAVNSLTDFTARASAISASDLLLSGRSSP